METGAHDMVRIGTITGEFWGARAVVSALEDAGIPRYARLRDTWVRFSDDPFTDPNAQDLYVRPADAPRAIEVVRNLRRDRPSIDWDAFDVGTPRGDDAIAVAIAADPAFQRRPSPAPRWGARIMLAQTLAVFAVIAVIVVVNQSLIGTVLGILCLGFVLVCAWTWWRAPGSTEKPDESVPR